jgi:hypothetical protein
MAQTAFDQTWHADDEQASFDLSGLPRTAYIPLLAALYGLGLGLYVSVEPTRPWLLLAVVALVGLGSDGILRNNPKAQLRGVADTSPFLFVPVLLALASGLFLEEVVKGYWAVPAAAGASVLLAGALYGEYASMVHGPSYALGRLVLNMLTYVAAFAFFAVIYEFNVHLLPAAIAVGLFSTLLAIEILREAEGDAIRALVYAAAIGVVVAEIRWALYFVPLDGYLAAIVLLVIFYQASGLVQHHLTGHLNRAVATEFSLVTAIGIAVVVAGRLLSIG